MVPKRPRVKVVDRLAKGLEDVITITRPAPARLPSYSRTGFSNLTLVVVLVVLRTDWNLQVIKWLVHQSRTCLKAKISAVKLEAIGPAEKDRELDVWHLELVTYTPAPPGPKREGTEPSVHTWISEGGEGG